MRHPSEDTIKNLKRLVKDYEGITELIKQSRQRIRAKNSDLSKAEQDEAIKNDSILNGVAGKEQKVQGLEQIKNRVSRMIEKELEFWPIWTEWMKHIPGIGPAIAAPLILLYYYKFVPVCPDCNTELVKQDGTHWCETCQKSVKGEGMSTYELKFKDFPNISAWRKYMGYHIIDGKMPKRQKGQQIDWNPKGRVVGYLIKDQFNRVPDGHLYGDFMKRRKARYTNDPAYKDYTKKHILNMAQHQTVKLFLSHFWDVAQRLDGVESPAKPWLIQFGGHTKYIPPYYWEDERAEKAA